MLFVYPAVFHKEGGAYWVEFPDLPGCQTFADTVTEAVSYSQEALTGYILTVLETGSDIPAASDIQTIKHDSNSFSTLVSCNISDNENMKSVKKTLTIPAWLNERAVAKGINFSQVLQDALISRVSG